MIPKAKHKPANHARVPIRRRNMLEGISEMLDVSVLALEYVTAKKLTSMREKIRVELVSSSFVSDQASLALCPCHPL